MIYGYNLYKVKWNKEVKEDGKNKKFTYDIVNQPVFIYILNDKRIPIMDINIQIGVNVVLELFFFLLNPRNFIYL